MGTSYSVLYEEVSKERGTFLRPLVYERVGISLVEVCKRVGREIDSSVCKRPKRANTRIYGWKKSRENFLVCVSFIL